MCIEKIYCRALDRVRIGEVVVVFFFFAFFFFVMPADFLAFARVLIIFTATLVFGVSFSK